VLKSNTLAGVGLGECELAYNGVSGLDGGPDCRGYGIIATRGLDAMGRVKKAKGNRQ